MQFNCTAKVQSYLLAYSRYVHWELNQYNLLLECNYNKRVTTITIYLNKNIFFVSNSQLNSYPQFVNNNPNDIESGCTSARSTFQRQISNSFQALLELAKLQLSEFLFQFQLKSDGQMVSVEVYIWENLLSTPGWIDSTFKIQVNGGIGLDWWNLRWSWKKNSIWIELQVNADEAVRPH